MMRLIQILKSKGRHRRQTAPVEGFGQSLRDDILFVLRFRSCRRQPVDWRRPTDEERRAIDGHPIFGRFGDTTHLVADRGGQRWIVRDRDWHGWPDPPEYVFFAIEGEAIRVARDFDGWPSAWGPAPEHRQAVEAALA